MMIRVPLIRVPHLLAFCCAYLFSFLLGLVLLRNHFVKVPLVIVPPQDAVFTNYKHWLSDLGLDKDFLSADVVSYNKEKISSEADFLRERVHVTCVIFARKHKKVKAIEDTWGRHCNVLKFFGSSGSYIGATDIGEQVVDKPKSSWHLLCAVIREVWSTYNDQLQWVLFIPEDLFVLPENLRLFVAALSPDTPYYFGHAMTLWNEDYNVAQAGYALSRAALNLIVSRFNSSKACETSGRHWKNEDYYLGKFLGELGVSPTDTRDDWKRGRFHGFNLNQLLFSHKLSPLGSYWRRSIYPVTEGLDCCSATSVTFQGIEPDKVYQLYYLLYQVKVFRRGGHRGNVKAPLPHGEEVWRKFLREEGLWDRPGEEISADLFYKLSEKRDFKLTLP